MVRQFTERKGKPSYDLGLLQRLAAAGSISYASAWRIEACLDGLGYKREHLLGCIAMLEPKNFETSGRYLIEGSTPPRFTFWMDVYRLKCMYYPRDDSDDDGRLDDLYIKLSLSHDCVCVTIQSFHEWDRQI